MGTPMGNPYGSRLLRLMRLMRLLVVLGERS